MVSKKNYRAAVVAAVEDTAAEVWTWLLRSHLMQCHYGFEITVEDRNQVLEISYEAKY